MILQCDGWWIICERGYFSHRLEILQDGCGFKMLKLKSPVITISWISVSIARWIESWIDERSSCLVVCKTNQKEYVCALK